MNVDEIKAAVETKILSTVVIPGWDTYFNKGWFESTRERDRQIYWATGDPRYMTQTVHEMKCMGIDDPKWEFETKIHLYVSCVNKEQRNELAKQIREDVFPMVDAVTDLPTILILREWNLEKDKKYGCLTWGAVFELEALY